MADAATAQGQPLKFEVDGAGVRVDKAYVIKADIKARNGVIHVTDKVVLPPS